jgi:hypothetical protein
VPGGVPRDLLLQAGPSLAEEAHNEYLQIAAELGLVGLLLYLWVLGAFFRTGIRALKERETGLRKLVLLGCLGGMAGQVVDALSNPAWRFADVSFLLWLMLGLGMATAWSTRAAPAAEPSLSPSRRPAPRRLGWQVVVLCLTLSAMGGAWARRGFCPIPLYHGQVKLRLEPARVELLPGQCARFRLFATVDDGPSGEVTGSPDARFFTNAAGEGCLTVQITRDPTQGGVVQACVPADACRPTACGNGRTVPFFASYAGTQAHALVTVVCP